MMAKLKTLSMTLAVLNSLSAYAYTVTDKANEFRFSSGFAFSSFSLSSDGYNLSLPQTLGLPLGGELITEKSRFRFRQVTTDFTAPTGYTPAQLTSVDRDIQYLYKITTIENGTGLIDGMSFYVGYNINFRSGTSSTPTNALSSYFSHGFAFAASKRIVMSEDLIIDSVANLVLPLYFDERFGKTGIYKTAQYFDWVTTAMYPISNRLALAAGIGIDYRRILFSGVGENNARAATMSQFGFSIPLEIRYFF